MKMFAVSDDEVRYGSVRIVPLMFQADIMRALDGVADARAGNIKVTSTMKSKQLQLNPNKTSFIMFGKKTLVEDATIEVAISPITCGSVVTKEKVADKCLGDMFHQGVLAASVIATIKDREPEVR